MGIEFDNDLSLYAKSMGKLFRITPIARSVDEANAICANESPQAIIAESRCGLVFIANVKAEKMQFNAAVGTCAVQKGMNSEQILDAVARARDIIDEARIMLGELATPEETANNRFWTVSGAMLSAFKLLSPVVDSLEGF